MPIELIDPKDLPTSIKSKLEKSGEELSAKDVLFSAAENLGPSAVQFTKDIVQPFIHPIQTVKDLATLGQGVYELFVPGEQANEEVARAVGQYFADRYGGIDNIKKTFATDPVGFIADATIIFSGGGSLISKTGKIAKSENLVKAGNAAKNIAQTLDPALLPLKAIRTTGYGTKKILGITSGASDLPIEVGFKAGKSSLSLDPRKRQQAQAFRKGMSGTEDAEILVQDARSALAEIDRQKKSAYRSGMSSLASGESKIDFSKVDKAIKDLEKSFSLEGELILSDSGLNALKNIKNDVARFKENPNLHTVYGLDALKRLIGKRYNNRVDANDVSALVAQAGSSIRKIIADESPEYLKIMDEFSKSEIARKEIENALSLGRRKAVDTAARKLQSAVREIPGDGTRLQALEDIAKVSGSNLIERLSGQALSRYTPKGLQQISQPISFMAAMSAEKPQLLGLLAAQTPRLVGEAAYRGGQFSALGSPLMQSLPYTRLFEATQQEEDPMQQLLRSLNK